MTDLKTFGQWMRKARAEAGMTLGQLAAMVNASLSTLVQFERGESAPSRVLAKRIEAALGRSERAPDTTDARVAQLERTLAVLRALWTAKKPPGFPDTIGLYSAIHAMQEELHALRRVNDKGPAD